MTTLASALNTVFTPSVGTFVAQCSNGIANLERRGTSGAAWVNVGTIDSGQGVIVENPVAGCQYQFVAMSNSPVVQADQ